MSAATELVTIGLVAMDGTIPEFALADDALLCHAIRRELASSSGRPVRFRLLSWSAKTEAQISGTPFAEPDAHGVITDEAVPLPRTWEDYNALVIRSTWDYHTRITEFWMWLDDLQANHPRVNVLNDVGVLRWNSSKIYLRDLLPRGVAVVPTLYVLNEEELHQFNLTEVAKRRMATLGGTTDAERCAIAEATKYVIKPVVSADSHGTFTVSLKEVERAEALLASIIVGGGCGAMVQPFMPQVLEEGEYSLIFFNDEFSHAIVKRPKSGDFRVQNKFGGTWDVLDDMDPRVVAQAKHVLLAAHDAVAEAERKRTTGEDSLPVRLHGGAPSAPDNAASSPPGETTTAPRGVAGTTADGFKPFPYARVDGFLVRASSSAQPSAAAAASSDATAFGPVPPPQAPQLVLMELELIEPSLFLDIDPPNTTSTGAADWVPPATRFARAVLGQMRP